MEVEDIRVTLGYGSEGHREGKAKRQQGVNFKFSYFLVLFRVKSCFKIPGHM